MSASPAPAPLRCPACGAPVDVDRLRPGQTALPCAYCGTLVPVPGAAAARPPAVRLASDGLWRKGGWAGDPRVWGLFVLLALGLVAYLVFGVLGGFAPQ